MTHEVFAALRSAAPDREATAVAALKKMIEPAQRARAPYETLGALCRAFYVGLHHTRLAGTRVETEPLDGLFAASGVARRGRFYSNQILPRVRGVVASLTANRPAFQVVTQDEDDDAARKAGPLGDEVLEGAREIARFDREMRSAVLLATITGHAFLDGGFDPALGAIVPRVDCAACRGGAVAMPPAPGAGAPVGMMGAEAGVAVSAGGAPPPAEGASPSMPEALYGAPSPSSRAPCPRCGYPGATVKYEAAGDFFARAYSLWEMLVDPVAQRLKDADWVVLEHKMSAAKARSRYGVDLAEEDLVAMKDLMPAVSGGAAPTRRGVRVFEARWRPSLDYPRGAIVFWGGERVLHWREEGTIDGRFGIEEIVFDEVPGRFYGKGIVEDLIPLNLEFTETLRDLFGLRHRSRRPKMSAEQGAVLTPDALQDEETTLVEFTPGLQRPEWEKPPIVSPVFFALLRELVEQMDFSSQHFAPSRGQPGSGVTSGLQASLLIERSATSLASVTASIEEASTTVGRSFLLAAKRLPEQRLLAYAGDFGKPKVVRFRGGDLDAVVDVRVVPGSAAVQSRVARQDFLLRLSAQLGAKDPESQRAVLADLRAGIRFPSDRLQVIRDKVADEVDRILAGEDVPVRPGDLNDFEIGEHLLAESSERAVRAAEPRYLALVAHRQAHEAALVLDAQRKRALAAAAGGDEVEPEVPSLAAPQARGDGTPDLGPVAVGGMQ